MGSRLDLNWKTLCVYVLAILFAARSNQAEVLRAMNGFLDKLPQN